MPLKKARQRMTLITAWPYNDGVIVCADSQETVEIKKGEEYKYSVLKLSPESMGNFQIMIAGGGNGEAIDSFIETIRQFLSGAQIVTLPELKRAIQVQLLDFRKQLRATGDDPTMHLFIAAHCSGASQIWRTSASTLTAINKPDMLGFTAHMYRHAATQLYWEDMPAVQALLASLKVLELARQTCTCVDKPFSAAVVRDNGISPIPESLLTPYIESIELLSTQVDRLLLACSDTQLREAEFEKHLSEFSDTVRSLRSEYKSEIAGIAFKRSLVPGYRGDPIPFVPPGVVISLGEDGSTTVEEISQVDIQDYELSAQEDPEYAELSRAAAIKLEELIRGRQLLYLADVTITLQPKTPDLQRLS